MHIHSLIALLCVTALGAQSRTKKGPDLRDRVTLLNGKEIRGRVLNSFAADELVVMRGGSRKRVATKSVRDVHTINDELVAFFALRERVGKKQKRRELLIEWAMSHKLPAMARLQALDVLRDFPSSTIAHEFLGHRLRGKGDKARWLWPQGERFVSRQELDKRGAKWGTAAVYFAEHFELKTSAGLDVAVDALFDLERFYLFFRDTFGAALEIREVLEPIRLRVWSNVTDFSSISARPIAFYDLRADACSSFLRADAKRPEDLFAITTQALLYHTVVASRSTYGHHLCAWAEIGLGQWMEDAFGGPAGAARARDVAILDTRTASLITRVRPKLTNVTHLPYITFHELSTRSSLRWDAVRTLTHFLMSAKPDKERRGRFMRYLTLAFKKGLGDSSRGFDKAMGEKAESLQPKFLRWVQVHRN